MVADSSSQSISSTYAYSQLNDSRRHEVLLADVDGLESDWDLRLRGFDRVSKSRFRRRCWNSSEGDVRVEVGEGRR